MSPGIWGLLLGLALLWGGSFFFVEIALEGFEPLTVVMLRVGLAALVLWSVVRFMGLKVPTTPAVWLAFLGMGILNNVIPFTLIVFGQKEITAGLASILNATTPLFMVLVASVLLADERAGRAQFIGVLIGFLGVVVMVGPSALAGIDKALVAELAVLGAALTYAFAGAFGRRFKRLGVDPVVTAAGQVTASAALMVPLAFAFEAPLAGGWPSLSVAMSVLGLAVLSTALAYVLYFKILASAGATNLLLVTFLIPVTAIGLGIVFLDETLLLSHGVGFALIGLGLSAIDGRLWRGRGQVQDER